MTTLKRNRRSCALKPKYKEEDDEDENVDKQVKAILGADDDSSDSDFERDYVKAKGQKRSSAKSKAAEMEPSSSSSSEDEGVDEDDFEAEEEQEEDDDEEEELKKVKTNGGGKAVTKAASPPARKLAELKRKSKNLESVSDKTTKRFTFETKFVSQAPSADCQLNLSESSSSEGEDEEDRPSKKAVKAELKQPEVVPSIFVTEEQPIKAFESPIKPGSSIIPPTTTKTEGSSDDVISENDDVEMASQLESLANSYTQISQSIADKKAKEETHGSLIPSTTIVEEKGSGGRKRKSTDEPGHSKRAKNEIANLLMEHEGISGSLSLDDDDDSDEATEEKAKVKEEEEEDGEGGVKDLQITVEVPNGMAKRNKKKAFDMEAWLKRELGKAEREVQLICHKAHFVFMIGHLRHVNDALGGNIESEVTQLLLAVAMSIVPPAHLVKTPTLVRLAAFANWFKEALPVVETGTLPGGGKLFECSLLSTLQSAMLNYTCLRAEHKVFIFVLAARSVGWNTRLVLNLDLISQKPDKKATATSDNKELSSSESSQKSSQIDESPDKKSAKSTQKSSQNDKSLNKKSAKCTKKSAQKSMSSDSKSDGKNDKASDKMSGKKPGKISEDRLPEKPVSKKAVHSKPKPSEDKSKEKDIPTSKTAKIRDECKEERSFAKKTERKESSSKNSNKADEHFSTGRSSRSESPRGAADRDRRSKDKICQSKESLVEAERSSRRHRSEKSHRQKSSDQSSSKNHSRQEYCSSSKSSSSKSSSSKSRERKQRSASSSSDCEKLPESSSSRSSRSTSSKTAKSSPKSRTVSPSKSPKLSRGAMKEARSRTSSKSTTAVEYDNSDEEFLPPPPPIKKSASSSSSSSSWKKSPPPRTSGAKGGKKEQQPAKNVRTRLYYWAEVWVDSDWVPVDVVSGKVGCAAEMESRAFGVAVAKDTKKPANSTKSLLYVIGANVDGSMRDVTRRYTASKYDTVTRKARVAEEFVAETLRPFLPSHNSILDRIHAQEDSKMDKKMASAPMPTSVGAFKNHPLYALQRHLLKFEAIYPPEAPTLGFIRGEGVYARECVHTLQARVTWLKEGRVVRVGEQPYKVVKARPKWDRMSGTMVKDQPLEVFGKWQTEIYIPPPAVDGKVPRNEYGNVELFKPWMLPKGTVHIPIQGLNKTAKKLNIDCAPAMMGWEFSGGGCHPVFDGFVICQEFQDVLMDAWNAEMEEKAKRDAAKKEKRVLDNWKKLVKGLITHEKIKRKYAKD